MFAASDFAFIAVAILTFFLGLSIFYAFRNRKARVVIERFLHDSVQMSPKVVRDIEMRYCTTSGYKTYIYPNGRGDLYVHDDCIVLVHSHSFIFKVMFEPFVIAPDIIAAKRMFNYLENYKPDRIVFKKIVKGEIDIRLTDLMYSHYKIEITLKSLTDEQIVLLEQMKDWC